MTAPFNDDDSNPPPPPPPRTWTQAEAWEAFADELEKRERGAEALRRAAICARIIADRIRKGLP